MSKIVVMDSGFGGLTVLRELIKSLPDEEYIYYGDSANAPYGEKKHEELLKLTEDICGRLAAQYDVKCFVIACNTTTSEVWNELTGAFPGYDFVGIEPALKWAVRENPGKRILVLATTATSKGRRLQARYAELKDEADITLLAAPGIVPAVEGDASDSDEFRAYMRELLTPYAGRTDCVVLGCTHFPFVKEQIREVLGGNISFYDAAVTVAEEVRALCEGKYAPERTREHNVPVAYHEDAPESRQADGSRSSKACGSPMMHGQDKADSALLQEYAADVRNTETKASDNAADGDIEYGNVIYLNSDPAKITAEEKLYRVYAGRQ